MKKGFSLIELLVVIGIIAILSVLVVPNFMSARQKARDAQRKSDLRQIQSALELFKDDQTSVQYPAALGQLVTTYMKQVPNDPLNTGNYTYVYTRTSNLTYTLRSCLENQADPKGTLCGLCGGSGVGNKCYIVSEP